MSPLDPDATVLNPGGGPISLDGLALQAGHTYAIVVDDLMPPMAMVDPGFVALLEQTIAHHARLEAESVLTPGGTLKMP